MTKLAICADIHVGNFKAHGGPVESGLNWRCRLVIDVLKRAVQTAAAEECDAFVVLGDLFDYSNPEPQVITAVRDALESDGGKMRKYLMVGNHDQVSSAKGDHALGPLDGYGKIRVIEEPSTIEDCMFLVPYRKGKPVDWLPEILRSNEQFRFLSSRKILSSDDFILLGLHTGLTLRGDPIWIKEIENSINHDHLHMIQKDFNIKFVFAGDFHVTRDFSFSGKLSQVQVGTLCPTSWSDSGMDYGNLWIVDKSGVHFSVIAGPRFINEDIWRRLSHITENFTFFVRSAVPIAHVAKNVINVVDAAPSVVKNNYTAIDASVDGSMVMEELRKFVSSFSWSDVEKLAVIDKCLELLKKTDARP